MKTLTIAIFISIMALTPAQGDDVHPRGIRLDGTLGNSGQIDIPGPEYHINAEYGQQAGANLFHSFQQFNLHSDESAIFNGPSGVENIISRVTGGDGSWLDGRLSSAIPGADMFFLNPAGIMFGPNVSLDLQGSFHASTADYLRMGNNERFYAEPLTNELLSVNAPAAFGFLDDDIAGIRFEGKGEISAEEWDDDRPAGLHVSEGENVSLIGGDIEITKGTFYTEQDIDDYGNPLFEEEVDEYGSPIPVLRTVQPGDIKVRGGQIRLIGAASSGEIAAGQDSAPDIQGGGKISISEMSMLDVSGEGGGQIYIRSGEFVLDESTLEADTFGARDGQGIEIGAETVRLQGARMAAITFGSGTGGAIKFHAKDISLGKSNIFASTEGWSPDAGDAGEIEINSDQLLLDQGSEIVASSFSAGTGGNIKIQAAGTVRLSGENSAGYGSAVLANAEDVGNGGTVELTADQLYLEDGAYIGANTYGPGTGGDINIQTNGTLGISGEDSGGYVSAIFTNAEGWTPDAGDGGTIDVRAGQLRLENGGQIAAGTFGPGQGGNVNIQVQDEAVFSGESLSGTVSGVFVDAQGDTEDAGDSGNLELNAGRLRLEDGAQIAASAFGSGQGGTLNVQVSELTAINGEGSFSSGILSTCEGETADAGGGGSINLNTKQLDMSGGGQMSAASFGPGQGGDINLQVSDAVQISGKGETSGNASGIYASAMSDAQDAGDGGRIELETLDLSLDSGGRISTSSKGSGKAGEIHLNVANLEVRAEAVVSSESHAEENGGDAGTITVDAEDSVKLTDRGALSTQANGAGGGKIFLNAGGKLYLLGGAVTSSVALGEGNGGDVSSQSQFVILNHANITANADIGDGGAIFIVTENFLKSSDAKVEAKSRRGNDGTVKIEAPDTDISSDLAVLPETYMDATRWMRSPCTGLSMKNLSSFVIKGRDAVSAVFDDWEPAPLSWPAYSNLQNHSDDKYEPDSESQ